ncbi:hypothetical protein D3C85_1619830 [compost metagenome]
MVGAACFSRWYFDLITTIPYLLCHIALPGCAGGTGYTFLRDKPTRPVVFIFLTGVEIKPALHAPLDLER